MTHPIIQYPLSVDGVLTRVLEAGSGPAVLFIHGLSTRADRWRAVLPEVAGLGYRAIGFDLPGHGLAQKGSIEGFEYSSRRLARYAVRLLDTLGIERAHLLGTSLGGHIAALATLEHPSRVATLHLTAPLGLAPVAPHVGEAIRQSVRDTSLEGIRAKFKNVFVDQAFATEALVAEESRINSSPGAIDALSELGAYIAQRLNDELVLHALAAQSPRTPLALLWGEHDRMVPLSAGEAAANALTGVPLVVMPATGHAPYVEQPAAFVAHWQRFLTQAGKGDAK